MTRSGGRVGFFFASPFESSAMVAALGDRTCLRPRSLRWHRGQLENERVSVALSGVGCERAERMLERWLDAQPLRCVISAGFAGALHEELQYGDVIVANSVLGTRQTSVDVDLQAVLEVDKLFPMVRSGRLLTVDRLVCTTSDKLRLGREHRAIACDMESIAIAKACRQHGTPFLSVRIVTDTVQDCLPQEVGHLLQQTTRVGQAAAAAMAVATRPALLNDLRSLRSRARDCSSRLARFLADLTPHVARCLPTSRS